MRLAWLTFALLAPSLPASGDQFHQFAFLGDRPYLIRLKISIGNQPLSAAWERQLRASFDYFDTNKSGFIEKDEANRIPSPVSQTGRATTINFGSLDTSDDQKATLEEFSAFLESYDVVSFAVQDLQTVSNRLRQAFEMLDTDNNQALSAEELSLARQRLLSRDFNDDEIVAASELQDFQSPIYQTPPQTVSPRRDFPANVPFLRLPPARWQSSASRKLLRRYDGSAGEKKDGALSPQELKIPEEQFSQLDDDGDQRLSAAELDQLATKAPDLSCEITFPGDKKPPTINVQQNTAANPIKVLLQEDRRLVFEVDNNRLFLQLDAANASANLEQIAQNQFRGADQDQNKYLERKEVTNFYYLNNLFELIDRDSDGKLFKKEFDEFIARQVGMSTNRRVLRVQPIGRAVFSLLDQNRDNSLSAREMGDAGNLIAQLDRGNDGQLTRDEIPNHFRLTITAGPAISSIFGFSYSVSRSARRPGTRMSAPKWFRKMDRNRDGDVSLREFLGPIVKFHELDVDKDGLLAPEEVRAASDSTN